MDRGPSWDYNCTANVTITSQGDVGNLDLTHCLNNITISSNATGNLSFAHLTQANGIYMYDSPKLEGLSLPDLTRLAELSIYHADSLTNVSLPRIDVSDVLPDGQGGWVPVDPLDGKSYLSLTIHDAPQLHDISFANATGFFGLDLELIGRSEGPGVEIYYSTIYPIVASLNSTRTLTIDPCYELNSLESAQFVRFTRPRIDSDWSEPCRNYNLESLKSVYSLDIDGSFNMWQSDDGTAPWVFGDGFGVDKDLSVSLYSPLSYGYPVDWERSSPAEPLRFLSSVGGSAHLRSSENYDLSLNNLTSVSGDLILENNTDCRLSFDALTRVVGAVSITDNNNSQIPSFPLLEAAGSIHLRGRISTDDGGNIFPSLKQVDGEVVIEPSNPDFNCSALVERVEGEKANGNYWANVTCTGTTHSAASSLKPSRVGALVMGLAILALPVLL